MKKRRILSLFLAVLMLCLAVTPALAEDATAAAMQLMKTEGTVSVTNASERNLTIRENMRLYNGYHAETKASSYAWINLDSAKLAKMDAASKVDVRKNGKKLELLVDKGNLYFNVTSPLKADETLNIRTSTMAIGIRGTAGWMKAVDENTTELYVLEGKVECVSADLASGTTKTATVNAGEKVVVTVRPGQGWEMAPEKFDVSDIDNFVMDELKQDADLCAKILEASGLDVLGSADTTQPAGEFATASGSLGDNITWSLSNGTLTVEGTGEIPAPAFTYRNNIRQVDFTAYPWYNYHEQIHTLVIGSGITDTGTGAFSDCSNLTSVIIPNSVTSIANSSFVRCSSLIGITIPDSVTIIHYTAFSGCSNLTSITIPASVTSIAETAFMNCTSLTDVYYGGSESQWDQITILPATTEDNALRYAAIHYNG